MDVQKPYPQAVAISDGALGGEPQPLVAAPGPPKLFPKSNAYLTILIFTWALINRSLYFTILVSCSDLAHYFQRDRLLSLYHGCLVAFSLVAKLVHVKYFLRVPHKVKLFVLTLVVLLGGLFMILAIFTRHFGLSLLGTVLIGVCFALSESIVQGFVKGVGPEYIGPLGAGGGLTGLVVSLGYFLMRWYDVELEYSFGVLLPLMAANQFLFARIVGLASEHGRTGATPLQEMEERHAHVNENLSAANLLPILRKLRYYSTCFYFYHVLAYGIIGVFGAQAIRQQPDPFIREKGFAMIMFVGRVSNFLTRCSFWLFKVRQIHLPVYGLFCVYLTVIAFAEGWLEPTPFYRLLAVVFLGGACEGFIFVNTLFSILDDAAIPHSQKEAALNLNNLCFELGIITSSVIGLAYMELFH